MGGCDGVPGREARDARVGVIVIGFYFGLTERRPYHLCVRVRVR